VNTPEFPLLRLPARVDMTLYLIGEELKSRTLFRAFHRIGLDDCYFQPHLDSAILRLVGLDASDDTFGRYDDIMDRRAKKIDACRDAIAKQALKAYFELRQLRKNPTANKGENQP
jgi:hypothetical protein